ncbi:MAG: LapA family protein [Acidimicrobiales bacterium]
MAPTAPEPLDVKRTRTGSVYVASIAGIVLLALVITFILQNLHNASVTFLAWSFRLPEGVVVLLSALAGAVVLVSTSLARILQLRVAARRHRRAHRPT